MQFKCERLCICVYDVFTLVLIYKCQKLEYYNSVVCTNQGHNFKNNLLVQPFF